MLTIEKLKAYGANVEEGMERCLNNEAIYFRLIGMKLALEPMYRPVVELTELLRRKTPGDYDALLRAILAQREALRALIAD